MKKHLTHIVWGGVSLILALSAETSCQQQLNVSDAATEPVDEIIFRAADPSLDAEVSTKATAVTSLTSFNVSAVTGAAGSETAVWTNVAFSGNNTDGYKAAAPGKWWPSTDASYRFYAANSALTFAVSGATVAATNATDIICAYMASPAYKAKNTLSFEHIFARLGQVTISAASGYTISGVSIKITPKTGGTYNLRTGAGKTDGTGWSGLATGSETVIGNTVGNTANDIYLVPGAYTLAASWTATKGDYTENIENMTCDVSLVAGKINNISTTLSGNAKEIVFNVNIAPWTDNNQVIEFPTKVPSFGGLQIALGPLMYEGGEYVIKDNWNYCSYNTAYGETEGSTYFTLTQMGALFEDASFDYQSGGVDNILDPLDGWRLPTQSEWYTLTTGVSPGTTREGSTINGYEGGKYAHVGISGIAYVNQSYVYGMLLFPDGLNITGKALNGINNTTKTLGFSLAELQNYLDQGCAFLPDTGYYLSSPSAWGDFGTGYYLTSTQQISNFYYVFNFSMGSEPASMSSNGLYYYYSVRLVKDI